MAYDTAIVLGFAAISFIMAYLAFKVDPKQHGVLQILFMVLSLGGILNIIGSMNTIIEIQGISQFSGITQYSLIVWIWATVFVIFYIIVIFIWVVVHKAKEYIDRKKKKRLGIDTDENLKSTDFNL